MAATNDETRENPEHSRSRYGFICFTRDKKDGKPHFLHGMQKEFTVK